MIWMGYHHWRFYIISYNHTVASRIQKPPFSEAMVDITKRTITVPRSHLTRMNIILSNSSSRGFVRLHVVYHAWKSFDQAIMMVSIVASVYFLVHVTHSQQISQSTI